ncbi:hypothetical protein [Streptomyces sp. NL15-2K]|uniref:hypothetical protein n=1 Tax=Streptomyces sp. NL15-2K TaxID=376149 RepID=UPI000F578515|nr:MULTISPECIES: hypothetical protein [Actinomycetes]WKX15294.1 hypothetical protein Q4V64_50500 [Kutzneria buriramensis]GCB52420.1 hypothetical protein SNL152K_9776 [Streptomyces sp. NL15-2K]
MDSELAALAASGATTLVSLMVTDSWTHARELVGRFLTRTGSDTTAITDLDNARTRLLATGAPEDEQAASGVVAQWHARLQQLIEAGSITSDDLRVLLTSLQRLTTTPAGRKTVHNEINGGVQHGPVIQSGRITGLTFHVHQSSSATDPG